MGIADSLRTWTGCHRRAGTARFTHRFPGSLAGLPCQLMLLRHLESLRAHGEWADAHFLSVLRDATVDVSAVMREVAHIRGAQEIWLARIEHRSPTLPIWPEWSPADLADAGPVVDVRLRAMFAELTAASLAQPLTYANLAGDTFHTPVGEILLHLMMHGHYHRGKANAALRSAGLAPVSVDYITWQREMAAASG